MRDWKRNIIGKYTGMVEKRVDTLAENADDLVFQRAVQRCIEYVHTIRQEIDSADSGVRKNRLDQSMKATSTLIDLGNRSKT